MGGSGSMIQLKTKTTHTEYLQRLFHDYAEQHGATEINLDDVFAWAMQNNLWEPTKKSLRSQFRQEMSRALSEEKVTDPQGRSIRRNHAAKVVDGDSTGYLWSDVFDAAPDHMQRSLQERRQRLVAMAIRHKRDVDSYNENNVHGAQLYFEYDLSVDIEEHEMPSEYDEGAGE